MSYKCVNCGAVKKDKSEVYLIENVNSDLLSPTCSELCAKEYKNNEVKNLEEKIYKIKNSKVIKDFWH